MSQIVPDSIKRFKVTVTVTGENGIEKELFEVVARNDGAHLDLDVTGAGGTAGAKVTNNLLLAAIRAVREAADLGEKDYAKGNTH